MRGAYAHVPSARGLSRLDLLSMRLQTQAKVSSKPGSPFTPVRTRSLQRKCACGGTAGLDGECAECRKNRLQSKTTNQIEPSTAPPIVHEVLRSSGQPLDSATRAFMEPRFGHDFGQVRVHTDARAANSARAVNALAYTVGRNVVFRAEQYAPGTSKGRQLLAHELAHVVQQSASVPSPLVTRQTDLQNAMETEAERAAEAIAHGQSFVPYQSQAVQVARRVPIPEDLPPEERRLAEDYLAEQAVRRGRPSPPGPPVVYMCSKDLETSPVGKHAFFRVGSEWPGNDTYSLEPVDRGADCYQGDPLRNFPADRNSADAACQMTAIGLSCLQAQFAAYPVGRYCTLGPNSNTFVGHIARSCGHANPDPPGWTPGIDASPPAGGTYAPSPKRTLLLGCSTKQC